MKILDEIINIQQAAWESTDAGLRMAATLTPRRNSTVYKAHFPDKPITPGVCMIGAVVELFTQVSGKTMQLAKVNNIKYLSMMTPDDIDGATLAATLSPDGVANAAYTKGDTTYAKMKLTIIPNH